jgi:alpha-1,3-rhamnosyl/mannosyltransferase
LTALRAGLELTVLELDASGTARAARGLAAALAERDDVEVVPLAHPKRGRAGGRVARGLDRELRWWPAGVARAAREAGVDLLHCPAVPGLVRGLGVPLVVTIHDVLALERPDWFTRANAAQQRVAVGRAARRAAALVAPSEATAGAVEARFGVRPRVVPWGVGAPFAPGPADPAVLSRHGLDGPYVVTVATLQPRKGLDAALDAHAALLDAGVAHRLVVVGARGWGDDALAARLERAVAAGTVVAPGRVEDAELVALLRGATCLVHPSEHEGFGFPPLEAMACGTPVVAVAASSVPEVVGDAGELVAPGAAALAAAVERLLGDPERRERLAEAGPARAAAFTWARCADRTVAVYRDALGR